MPNNTIQLTFKVNEDGSLRMISSDAKKAAKDVENLANATTKNTRATEGLNVQRNKNHKLEKGTAQLTSNSTKAFAKQATTLGGTLVPAYATLAANIFALTAAFGALSRAAALTQLEQGLIAVGSAAGQNLPRLAQRLKEITGAAISTRASMEAVALGISAGFNTKQLEDLTKVAKGASLALGRNLEDALTRLVKGTAKLEPEILDELGILVRLDTATEKYATQIGKAVGDLTQFERRHAFLNETINQGLDKFGLLADTIDPNPYDRLASAFDGINKTGFKMINVVLTPLVSFLSSTPTALLGVLTLFAATIVRKIVPALNEAVASQRKLAAGIKQEAEEAAVAAEAAFKRKAAELKVPDVAPKSIQALKGSLQEGTVSAKQLTASVRNLKLSEQLRAAALERYAADNKKYSVDFVNQKKAELAAIKQLRIDTETLAAAEKRRSLGSREQMLATARSGIANRQASTLDMIGGAGAIGGFKHAFKGIGGHYKEIGTLTNAVDKLKTTVTATTASTRLLGRAFLNLIPVLGTILFVGSLLLPVFRHLWGDSETEKAIKGVVDSLKELEKVGTSLNNIMQSSVEIQDKYLAGLRGEVGVIDQVLTGLRDIQRARAEEQHEKILELQERRAALEAQINGAYMDPAILDALKRRHTALGAEIAAAKELQGELSKKGALAVIDTTLKQISAFPDAARKSFAETESELEKLKQRINDDEFSGPGGATKANEAVQGIIGEKAAFLDAVKESTDAVSAFDAEINKLAQKDQTMFDGSIDAFENLTIGLKTASRGGTLVLLAFLAKNRDFADRLKRVYLELNPPKNFLDFLKSFNLDNAVTAANHLLETLKANRKTIIQTKAEVKRLENTHRDLSRIASGNTEIAQAALEAEIQALQRKREGLQATVNSSEALELVREETQEIKTLDAEILTLQNTLAYKVDVERARQAQNLVNLKKREADATKQILEATMAIAKSELTGRFAGANQDVSAAAELKLFQDQRKAKLELEEKLLGIKKEGIRAEFMLLRSQLLVARAIAKEKGLGPEVTSGFDTQLGMLAGAENAALTAAERGFQLFKVEQETTEQTLLRKKAAEELAIQQERSALSAERLIMAGREIEALEVRRLQALKNIETAQENLDKIRDAGEDPARAELEVQKAITEELKIQFAIIDQKIATVQRLAGETVGAFAEISGGIEKGILAGAFDKGAPISNKIKVISESMQPFFEQLRTLGPEGELNSLVVQGALNIAEAFSMAFEQMGEGATRAQSTFLVLATAISAIGNIAREASQQRINAIDGEIEAEKKRDGKSAQSVAKIQSLEKKKEAAKRAAFEKDKKYKMAEAISSTALAIANALATQPFFPMGLIMAGVAAAAGAIQIATIASSSYQGGSSSAPSGPSKVSLGERSNNVNLADSGGGAGELAYLRGQRGTGTNADNFTPSFAGTMPRNVGGSAGLIVGEQGPELFVPEIPGTIIPADETANLGGTVNVNFSINAIDSRNMEQALRSNRGQIIGMIREAANARGEFFLENVQIRDGDTN